MIDHGIEGVGEVDVEDLLAQLDAANVHDVGRDEVGFSCFWVAGHAHGDQNPSAHVNRDTLLWRCKSCRRAGNLLELVKVARPEGVESHPQALSWLREHFGEVVRKPRGGSLTADLEARLAKARYRPPERRLPNEAETIGPQGIFALDWRSDHQAALYMRGRGFAPEVLEDWGVGYDGWTRRVAIPVRDADGLLVGFKGRIVDNSHPAKYMLLGDTEDRQPRYGLGYGFDMHDARVVLFGLDRAKGSKRVALVEGELNVVACHAAGVPAVAPGTTYVTAEQLWLLRAYFDELVNFYDSDDAGQDAVWGRADPVSGNWYPGQVETVARYFRLFVVDDHEGDPASMGPTEVRRLYETCQHWAHHLVPSGAGV
jgi:hypothetical protein